MLYILSLFYLVPLLLLILPVPEQAGEMRSNPAKADALWSSFLAPVCLLSVMTDVQLLLAPLENAFVDSLVAPCPRHPGAIVAFYTPPFPNLSDSLLVYPFIIYS